jgi:hypothetical protein
MRRLLRDIIEERALGDTTTLADPSVIAALKKNTRTRDDLVSEARPFRAPRFPC